MDQDGSRPNDPTKEIEKIMHPPPITNIPKTFSVQTGKIKDINYPEKGGRAGPLQGPVLQVELKPEMFAGGNGGKSGKV